MQRKFLFTYIKFLFLWILLHNTAVYAQDVSKNSIKIGVGAGTSTNKNLDGLGLIYSIGYERDLWKDRLHFNPNFSIGHYSSKFVTDSRDQYYNSINLELNLFFEILKGKSSSIVVGSGILANNTRGLLGLGGLREPSTSPQTSEYISEYHFAGYLGAGLRINTRNKRYSMNIMPVNIHFGNNYFAEFNVKLEFVFRF